MILDLYKCIDDPRTLRKNLTDKMSKSVTLKEDTDIYNPTYQLAYDADILDGYNYAQCGGRSYFIRDVVAITGQIISIVCKEDVLMTYADQILQCPVIVGRSDNNYNAYISDPKRCFYQHTTAQYITIGDIGYPSSVVMVTVG